MRNKPRVISLKTPSYERETAAGGPELGQNPSDKERLAEEGGILAYGGNSDVFDPDSNGELHPIMGTTRPLGQGSLGIGRPLEVD